MGPTSRALRDVPDLGPRPLCAEATPMRRMRDRRCAAVPSGRRRHGTATRKPSQGRRSRMERRLRALPSFGSLSPHSRTAGRRQAHKGLFPRDNERPNTDGEPSPRIGAQHAEEPAALGLGAGRDGPGAEGAESNRPIHTPNPTARSLGFREPPGSRRRRARIRDLLWCRPACRLRRTLTLSSQSPHVPLPCSP